jgi:cob(I)alamin adenosyltransferase
LYGGHRVSKTHPRIAAYGTLDELNAQLGFALSQAGSEAYRNELKEVQADLFTVGAELATSPDKDITGLVLLTDEATSRLERAIDAYEAELPELTKFILPGGTLLASSLQLARAVTRRAERQVVELSAQAPVRGEIVRYLNRLSDYLFTLARYVNYRSNHAEDQWRGR